MSTFIQSWRESVVMLYPKQITLYVLAIYITMVRTYTYLLRSFFILFLLNIIVSPSLIPFVRQYIWRVDSEQIEDVLRICLLFSWLFAIYLCARPSVWKKQWRYYIQYYRHIFYGTGVMFIALYMLSAFWLHGIIMLPILWFGCTTMSLFPLFLFDQDLCSLNSTARAICNSSVMVWYNMPLWFLVSGAMVGIYYGLKYIFLLLVLPVSVQYMLLLLLLPFVISFITVTYIKRLYEQSSLYF